MDLCKLMGDKVKSLQSQMQKKLIAIDGKSSRHSFDEDTDMLHMVSAYAAEARLVLAQEKVSEKSNEITALTATRNEPPSFTKSEPLTH
jgi:hypothetical protein